jgi:hypothetical protein
MPEEDTLFWTKFAFANAINHPACSPPGIDGIEENPLCTRKQLDRLALDLAHDRVSTPEIAVVDIYLIRLKIEM